MYGFRPLSCVIIDDETPAHQILKFYIDKIPWLQFRGSIYNSIDAISTLPILKPDIIFLDVAMPNFTGLQLIDILELPKTSIILISAHVSFAVESYHYRVTYFLSKPVNFEAFCKAVTKAREDHQTQTVSKADIDNESESHNLLPVNDQVDQDFRNDALWIKSEKKMIRIDYHSIAFLEGAKNYVKIIYNDNENITTRVSLTEFERKLPTPLFVRTHKSYIVNRIHIERIDGNQIILKNGYRVSISPQERNTVIRLLTRNDD